MSKENVYLTIRIEPKIKKELRLAALKNDTTVTEIIKTMIDEYLEKQ